MELDDYFKRLNRLGAAFPIHDFKFYSKFLATTTECALWLVDFRRIHSILPALRSGLINLSDGSKPSAKDGEVIANDPSATLLKSVEKSDASEQPQANKKQSETDTADSEVDADTRQFRELVHAVCGLHDTALGSMSPTTIYANLSERNSRTMVVVLNVESAAQFVRVRYQKRVERERRKAERLAKKRESQNGDEEEEDEAEEAESESDEDSESSDRYESDDDDVHYLYDDVFSSSDSATSDEDEEEEEDDDEEVDFSLGCYSFIDEVIARKTRQREGLQAAHEASTGEEQEGGKTGSKNEIKSLVELGIENRLVAASTFSMRSALRDAAARIVHLKLLAVRKSFRGSRIGARLVECLKDRTLLGEYDALVTHADPDAVGFFEKLGFSDDPFLNRNWRAFEFEYTNARLMTFVPAFSLLNMRLAEHARHQLVPSTTFKHSVNSQSHTRADSLRQVASSSVNVSSTKDAKDTLDVARDSRLKAALSVLEQSSSGQTARSSRPEPRVATNEDRLFELLSPKNAPAASSGSAAPSASANRPADANTASNWTAQDDAVHTSLNVELLDAEIRSWQRASETAHGAMYVLIEKLRHAIVALREEGRKDAELIRNLARENGRLRDQNSSLQRSVLLYRKIVLDTLDDDEQEGEQNNDKLLLATSGEAEVDCEAASSSKQTDKAQAIRTLLDLESDVAASAESANANED